ncbi:uncharacterized protein N7518_000766 [Penicillium psychrosexuale]|uniref:uncharacterized protein n=1 Tax=Penicillium psychrosexuale TaxID=1002107 RepID=UPI002544E8FA|nr:uncharacterized protein N7518_000766 [Penicillium psychrosexuale]KAJ5804463.1 hypothetical protein N7518_000766 [Penicillium psychrosexuale]
MTLPSVVSDHDDSDFVLPPQTDKGKTETSMSFTSLMSALPTDCIIRTFSRFKGLRLEAKQLLKSLQEKGDGNQFIVVLNLSALTIKKLDEEHQTSLGGIEYRFQWEGTTGLIKVVPSERHDAVTNQLGRAIDMKLTAMGLRWSEMIWTGTATYKPTVGVGKQGDHAFLPPIRCPNGLPSGSWPTFVIETGVSESLPRLREDAKRWFIISQGLVRIVILISIKATEVTFEKWQLAPPVPHPHSLEHILIHSARSSSISLHLPTNRLPPSRHTQRRRSTSGATMLSGPPYVFHLSLFTTDFQDQENMISFSTSMISSKSLESYSDMF